jgi:hypothetical protein
VKKLYIFLDGVRRDFLKPYGYYIDNMPNIKSYLTKFQKLNMYSPAAWTPCVMSSVFSNLMPWEHGVLRPLSRSNKAILNKNLDNHSQVKKQPGKKIFITTNPWFLNNSKNGLSSEWDVVDGTVGAYNYNRSDLITELGKKYIMENEEKDFTILLHFMDAHGPHNVGVDDFVLKEDECKISDTIENYKLDYDGMKDRIEMDLYYNACIRKMDRYLLSLFQLIDKNDLWNEMEIILFSDHGQALTDHYDVTTMSAFKIQNRHGLLFQEGIHVPCFFWSSYKKYSSQATYHLVDLFGEFKHHEYIYSFMANHYNKVLGSIIYENKKLIFDYINDVSYWTDLEKDSKEKNMEILGEPYMNAEARKYFSLLNEKIDINEIKKVLGGSLITNSIYLS